MCQSHDHHDHIMTHIYPDGSLKDATLFAYISMSTLISSHPFSAFQFSYVK